MIKASQMQWPIIHAHTCHKLWTEICEMRQIYKWDLIKFCEIFTKITLKLPQNSQKPVLLCMKFVINTTKCDVCLNTTKYDVCLCLHKMCFKMVWKFCEIWTFYGNWLPDGPNSVRFYLTVWDMACMHAAQFCHTSMQNRFCSQNLLLVFFLLHLHII